MYRVLARSRRPLSLYAGLGANTGLYSGDVFVGPGFAYGGFYGSAFQLEEGLAYHFSGDATGFAIGGALQERFSGVFALTANVRLEYDIAPISRIGFYIEPLVLLGAGFETYYGGNLLGLIHIEPALDLKLTFGDPWYVFVRPIGIQINILPAAYTFAAYDFMAGGGVTF